MFRVLSFLSKKPGIGMAEFIDHYENTHVPLICSFATTPIVYKRRYLCGEKLTSDGGAIDFDVVTELAFADRESFLKWMESLSASNTGGQVAADEAKFLDRSRTRAYVVEEYVTSS